MPLATSDFRNPVCQEMRSLRFNAGGGGGSRGDGSGGGSGGGGSAGEAAAAIAAVAGDGGGGSSGMEQLGSSLMEPRMSPIQPPETLSYARTYNEQGSYAKAYNEQGSVDSTDTYASCQTHPSHSQVREPTSHG